MGKGKLYHRGAIALGLILFLGAALSPIWLNIGKHPEPPSPVLSEKARTAGACIQPKAAMKTGHMQLLDDWRIAVRSGARIHITPDGKRHTMSLTNTCLDCHDNKAEFCDRCHTYAGAAPDCWACHMAPKELP